MPVMHHAEQKWGALGRVYRCGEAELKGKGVNAAAPLTCHVSLLSSGYTGGSDKEK